MVRKLVLVQKSGGEETVPYLVYWTDFSSKRKDPLKVSVSYAFTEERAQALVAQLIRDNVVRGWSPLGRELSPENTTEKPKKKSAKSKSTRSKSSSRKSKSEAGDP